MSDSEPQPYIAYRGAADEFEVHFFGGPLDGSTIRTDVLPRCEAFIHHFGSQSHVYRYQWISKAIFHATHIP